MSTFILDRTINSVTDRVVQLKNSQIARKMFIADNWSAMRIGLRCGISPFSTEDITGSPILAVGLTNGTTSTFGDNTTTHFVGVKSVVGTWSYDSGEDMFRNNGQSNNWNTVVKTSTESTGTAAGAIYMGADGETKHLGLFVDISKGAGGSWSFRMIRPDFGAGFSSNISQPNFFTQMEAGFGVAAIGSYAAITFASPPSVDEATNGVLNSINISWNRTLFPLLISDLAYARLG